MKKEFNSSQRSAILHGDGPCIVLSGPGSGKTLVLTNRILNLVVSLKVKPDEILVLTFTRAAANEMKERFLRLLNENNYRVVDMPVFGTFHSVFYGILKNDFGYSGTSLIDEIEEKRILSEVLEPYKRLVVSNTLLTNILTDIKNYRQSIEKEEDFSPRFISERLFNEVYSSYDEKLFNYKKLTFDDMITKCYELLSENKDILSYYQNKYKYVLIDEFQDINTTQYNLIKLICKTNNLFVVGDDDQSIYKFRGSHPKVMRQFVKDYKLSKKVYLAENYRSAKRIVDFSKKTISFNKERFDKELVAKRDLVGELEIKTFVDAKSENEYIISCINKYRLSGIKLSEMAILYRTNILSNSIRGDLFRNNICYRVKGEGESLYNNFAVRDILSYLKYAIREDDSKELLNIANKPLRYISRDAIKMERTTISDLMDYYKNKEYVVTYLNKFKRDLAVIRDSVVALAIRYIRYNIGYEKYLQKYCSEKCIDYMEIKELLDALEEEAILYSDIEKFLNYIENDCKPYDTDKDHINLMTFHISKGLEYKVVFIIDANDNLVPHSKSLKQNDIETERRLFYVAMTRAKDYLHIFFTTRRFGKNFKASRFLVEAIGGRNG